MQWENGKWKWFNSRQDEQVTKYLAANFVFIGDARLHVTPYENHSKLNQKEIIDVNVQAITAKSLWTPHIQTL